MMAVSSKSRLKGALVRIVIQARANAKITESPAAPRPKMKEFKQQRVGFRVTVSFHIILQGKMAGDTQGGIHHAAVEKEERRIETEKADNAANEDKYPTDRLAEKTADAGSAPGG